jgi:hypothetical protein
MLSSATRYKQHQDDLATVAVASARRAWERREVSRLARLMAVLQMQAARDAQAAVGEALAEQSIVAPAVAVIAPEAFRGASDGRTLTGLFAQARSWPSLEAMVTTQIADTGRAATSVATAVRPKVKGYIRNVGATCCSRCAILAGRFYRYSDGFKRHENCKCTMVPSDSDEHIDSPDELFRQGRITDLSKADAEAVRDGADMGVVVNVRRSKAGLTEMGAVLERGGRVTPAGIYRLASDRDDAIRLLTKHGYVR